MYLQKKIYEAIQRGLTKGLNFSFDDEVDLQNISKKQIAKSSFYDAYLDSIGFVDLDLPSGTLWAKHNIGATSPEEYGDYYVWSDVSPVQGFAEGKMQHFTNDTILPQQYDVATLTNKLTHLPTIEQINELIAHTKNYVYTINGVNGRIFESLKNSNKHIFIPAAGYKGYGRIIYGKNDLCFVQSSEYRDGGYHFLQFEIKQGEPVCDIDTFNTNNGYSARAVMDKNTLFGQYELEN